jgi:hypothetical protein
MIGLNLLVVGGLSALGTVLRSTETLTITVPAAAPSTSTAAAPTAAPAAPAAEGWLRGPRLRTGRFGACVIVVHRQQRQSESGSERKEEQRDCCHHYSGDACESSRPTSYGSTGICGVGDVLVAGGYNFSKGKLSSVELLDQHAPPPSANGGRVIGSSSSSSRSGNGSFLEVTALSVARSPWSHGSEGVEGEANPFGAAAAVATTVVASTDGNSNGGGKATCVAQPPLVFGLALASVAGREGTAATTPFKSPQSLK